MKTPPILLKPFSSPFSGEVFVPGSKSLTNRIFPLAVLSQEKTNFSGALKSEDAEIMKNALAKMGAKISENISDNINKSWEVEAGDFFTDTNNYQIFCGNSGTTIRFLTALCALRKGKTTFTGVERMQKRPIGDLTNAIEQLGASVKFLGEIGFPNLEITPIPNWENISEIQKISLSGKLSSQFFTALLHIAPMFPAGLEISVTGDLVSKPYIDMTLSALSDFGVNVENTDNKYQKFIIKNQKISAPKKNNNTNDSVNFEIEGDASSASYPLSIGLITGGKVSIKNLPKNSVQGDAKFQELVIDKMRPEKCRDVECNVSTGLKPLGEIDLEDIPDVAMTAVVLCAYADGYSKISGLSTLRHKECDRIFALESNLKKLGVKIQSGKNHETGDEFVEIWGDPEKLRNNSEVVEIECFEDHRVAMCFAVLSTVTPNIKILDPDCVQKTYPSFWEDLEMWRG